MPIEDSDEITSRKDLTQIRRDIEELKRAREIAAMPKLDDLKDSIERLNVTINDMMNLFKTASTEIKAQPEPTQAKELSKKMDELIHHNEDIARAILLLLELNREHLPEISKHTKMSSALLRQRSMQPRPNQQEQTYTRQQDTRQQEQTYTPKNPVYRPMPPNMARNMTRNEEPMEMQQEQEQEQEGPPMPPQAPPQGFSPLYSRDFQQEPSFLDVPNLEPPERNSRPGQPMARKLN